MTTHIYIIEYESFSGQWELACEADGNSCLYFDAGRAHEVAEQLQPQFADGALRVTEFHRGQSRVVE